MAKPRIRLAFCDFWPSFDPRDNYFARLLSPHYEIELSDRPDFLIYGDCGGKHRQFRCVRIFYTAECRRPDFFACDYAFTFDYSDHPNHYRLPVYGLYEIERIVKRPRDFDPAVALAERTRFCNFVYSNPAGTARNRFFRVLSKYKRVDAGGTLFNNVGGRVPKKEPFLRQYKFTIAFENQEYPGYTTEKIAQAMIAGSMPIYWGDPLIARDFNPRSFVNFYDFGSEEALIERVIALDRDDCLYAEHVRAPWYHDNRINAFVDPANVLKQFERIFSTSIRPAATQPAAQWRSAAFRLRTFHTHLARHAKRVAGRIRHHS